VDTGRGTQGLFQREGEEPKRSKNPCGGVGNDLVPVERVEKP